ncbi:MAG: hypothetical protein ACJ8R9_10920 [Steroidobacteraceae bacterium]
MGSYVIVDNLPPVPKSAMYVNEQMSTEWFKWFQALRNRVGGPSGDLIYDAANSSQATATLEGYLFGIRAELEQSLTGLIAQTIEQLQSNPVDPTGLITETYQPPVVEIEPIDNISIQFAVGAALGSFSAQLNTGAGLSGGGAITNGAVLTLTNTGVLSNVAGTGIGVSGATGNVTITNTGVTSIVAGSNVTVSGATGAVTVNATRQAPDYQEFVAAAAQTVFNTTITTTAKSGSKSYLQVYVNGTFKQEGGGFAYTVTGTNQITFIAGLALNDNVVIYGWS